jgi:hypothetical protein
MDRRLAQADVVAPDGNRYLVRISRNLPLRDSPVPGPIDALLPSHVSAAILVAANAYTRGKTGWTIKIYRAPTPYRSERFVHKEKSRDPAQLVARAFEITDAILAGRKPWDEDP